MRPWRTISGALEKACRLTRRRPSALMIVISMSPLEPEGIRSLISKGPGYTLVLNSRKPFWWISTVALLSAVPRMIGA